MILDTIKANLSGLFTKSQKANYELSAAGSEASGQEIPAQYSPNIRLKIYRTPTAFMAINTIAKEIAKVDWEIVPVKSILETFGYGASEGKAASVLSTKEWGALSRKYTDVSRRKLPQETLDHIKKVYQLLKDPNENEESFTEIRKKLATDLMIHDAATIEKTFNGLGEVAEIYTAPAPYIRMNFDKNGKLLDPAYMQYDPAMPKTILAKWSKDELIYMMNNPISTSMYGVSPIDVVAQIIATLVNALNYNGTYFESAALPEGYFTLPNLSAVQAKRLMQKWEQDIKAKAHKVLFMPEGATWHQFRFNNLEMQWLQGQKFYAEIVFAVLGVTKHELGMTEDINKATGEQQSFVFKNKSIIPILNLLSEKINQGIIGKSGFGYDDVMFVFKNVDLADKETMDKIHDKAVKSGRMTINEAREESGKIPYPHVGDEPVIATSQGLVFLKQFDMKFEEYKEEHDWLSEQAKENEIPVAEMRRILQGEQSNNDIDNNTDSQPQSPPSPSADTNPPVDESKKSEWIEGLDKLAEKIDETLNDEKADKKSTDSNSTDD